MLDTKRRSKGEKEGSKIDLPFKSAKHATRYHGFTVLAIAEGEVVIPHRQRDEASEPEQCSHRIKSKVDDLVVG